MYDFSFFLLMVLLKFSFDIMFEFPKHGDVMNVTLIEISLRVEYNDFNFSKNITFYLFK